MNGAETHSLSAFTVLGHRGAKGHAPENTLPSFEKAVSLKANMVELDIHLSQDDELVVMHDPRVDRTTNGTGRIREMPWAEIKRLDAGSWYGTEYSGVGVPRLQDVVDAVGGRVLLNVEVKRGEDGPYPGITDRLADLLEAGNFVHRVVISSFESSYLKELRTRLPDVELALLYSQPRAEVCSEALDEGWQTLHAHMRCIAPEFVDEVHRCGLRVRAWNPNEVEDMRPLIAAGVDGVGTDYPERLHALAVDMGVLDSA